MKHFSVLRFWLGGLLATLLVTVWVPARAQTEAIQQATQLAARTRTQWAGTDIPTTDFRISSAYSEPSGLLYAYPQQLHAGIPVYNQVVTLVFKGGALHHHAGTFLTAKTFAGQPATPAVTAAAAVATAIAKTGVQAREQPSAISGATGVEQQQSFAPAGVARRPIEARLVWAMDKGTPRLAWNVNVDLLASSDWLNIRVDAATGQLLGQDNWTVKENAGHSAAPAAPRAVAQPALLPLIQPMRLLAAPMSILTAPMSVLAVTPASYFVVPFAGERPDVTPLQTDTNPWLRAGVGNPAATHGWHFDGTTNYTDTRGNNVWAYDDSLRLNAPGRFAVSTGTAGSLVFNYVPDFTRVATLGKNRRAATVNLFYWNNLIHDVMYQYGLTEAAGNFQTDNISRGGLGNDYVQAEAQDGLGVNNANFATPADGTRPRMQMFLWNLTTPGRDGDFDNGIIVHEYGHGISNRLTGGPANVSCLGNAEQGGEGWSDYYGLMMTTNWATAQPTDGANPRPIGTYVLGQSPTAVGIRRYPYSTSLSVNPLTYANVATNTLVHAIGEVWCATLWDMTWNIIQQTSIEPNLYNSASTGGNAVALQLVTQGLKLQPCQPGFLDARDAILAADSLLYNGRYHCAIWSAFARRGMGYSARQGSSASATDQTAAFDSPAITLQKTTTPLVGSQFNLAITATCRCQAQQVNITDLLPADLQYISSTGGTLSGRTVTFANQAFTTGQTRTYQIVAQTAPTKGCALTYPIDDNRETTTTGGLTPAVVTGTNSWAPSTTRAFSGTTSWKAIDPATTSDVTLTSAPFTPSSLSSLSFQHYYNTEPRFDGGLVAISVNNGAWVDAAPYFEQNGYNAIFTTGTVSVGKPCFSGLSSAGSGPAAFQKTVLNLNSFNGQSIRVRFQFQSDASVSGEGWYLDDIRVTNGCGDFHQVQLLSSSNTVLDSYRQALFLLPLPLPTITSFTPTSGPVGTSVALTGTNLTGATEVRFNGTAAITFTVNSATSITATVPAGATTGTLAVTTPGGIATSAQTFTVTVTTAPVVTTTAGTTTAPQQVATIVDAGVTVASASSATLASASVTISSGLVSAQDVLGATVSGGVTGVYTAATGVLALSGTATLAQYQTILRSVTYLNSSSSPNTTARTLSFVVNDGSLASAPATKVVQVQAVSTAPTVPVDTDAAANTVPENSANGTLVGLTAFSTDPDSPTITYSLTNNAGGRFAINATTGVVSVANGTLLNYEVNTSHSLVVQAFDGTLTSSQTFTIQVTDVNETPIITAQTFTAAENAPNGTVVGTVVASDPDAGQTLSYSITAGNTGGAFTFVGNQLRVANSAALIFTTTPTFSLTVRVADSGAPQLAATATVTVNLTPGTSSVVYRLNAGGGQVVNSIGTFAADQYFTPSRTFSSSAGIAGTTDDAMYQTERFDGVFGYALPVPNGTYSIVLHFAELYWTQPGQRLFDVRAEGQLALDNYDIVAKVGPLTATTETLTVTVSDGVLNLDFSALAAVGGRDAAKLSALEVLAPTATRPGAATFATLATAATRSRIASLLQAAPNPFTDQVSLDFQLVRTEAYTLTVYDLAGRELTQVAGGLTPADVRQHVTLPLSTYPIGVYLVRLSTTSGTQQVRVVKQ